MIFVYGMLGFCGFEALRIYDLIWKGKRIPPKSNIPLYILIIIILGVFSGICAHGLSNGTLAGAIFVGFSVPSSIESIFKRSRRPVTGGTPVEVDDIEIHGPERITIISIVCDYFQ